MTIVKNKLREIVIPEINAITDRNIRNDTDIVNSFHPRK